MKEYEIGLSSITTSDESDIMWTGVKVEAKNKDEAHSAATDLGYYRNVRLREVEAQSA